MFSLAFLNPALAGEYRGFAAVMVLLSVLFLVFNVWYSFRLSEQRLLSRLNDLQRVVYLMQTGRLLEATTPPMRLNTVGYILGYFALGYIGMMLFGGELSLLWGVLFALAALLLAGLLGGLIFTARFQPMFRRS